MERRDVLKYTAVLTGVAVGGPLLSSIMSGCASEAAKASSGAQDLKFFNSDEFAMLMDIVDVILPSTESPSASEVGVHVVIDNMLGVTYTDEDKAKYRTGFDKLKQYLNSIEGSTQFVSLGGAKKLSVLTSLDLAEDDNLEDVNAAFHSLKQQTVAYYLSSEEIGKNFLNYLPVPGEYQPCIQLSEVGGKAWAI